MAVMSVDIIMCAGSNVTIFAAPTLQFELIAHVPHNEAQFNK